MERQLLHQEYVLLKLTNPDAVLPEKFCSVRFECKDENYSDDTDGSKNDGAFAFVLEIVHKRDFYAKVLFFIGKRCRLQKTCLNLHDKSDRI